MFHDGGHCNGYDLFLFSPPLRTKRLGIVANITIAIPRGVLLKVCGWSTIKTIYKYEPWLIGLVFGLFLLGATSTKDFSDIKGDRANGCMTLPIKYGVRRAAWMIAGFFYLSLSPHAVGGISGYFNGKSLCLEYRRIWFICMGFICCCLISTETGGIDDLREPYRMETHVLDDDGYPGYFRCGIFTMNIHRKCLPSWKWGAAQREGLTMFRNLEHVFTTLMSTGLSYFPGV